MTKLGFLRTISCLTVFVVLASCTTDENPTTLQGEPLVSGADPDAVVRTIDLPDYPAVFLVHEKGAVNIGIFQPETGSPVLQLRDDNNDGIFDLLTYSALSEAGEVLVNVEDWGMDGQPDLILNHQDSSASVFVDGSWHEVDGIGTRDVTVLLDGKRVALKEIVTTLGRPK